MAELRNSSGRPWLSGELAPSRTTDPKYFDAACVLDEKWRWVIPVPSERAEAMLVVHPFTRDFPGLAPAVAGDDSGQALDAVAAELTGRLGLVAVERPADAVAAIGWMGAVNYDLDMGALAAVLRSWELRFGAYVVGIGFDTLTLGVQRPPTSMQQALAIAAEHFAICSDIVYQGAGTLEAYAGELLERPVWSLWWD